MHSSYAKIHQLKHDPVDDESDEDDYEGAYAGRNHLGGDVDDDLPDTTMLDSVVLPAIASVSSIPKFWLQFSSGRR